MIIQEFVFEMRCGMKEFDHILYRSSKKGLKNSSLNGDLNPDLCNVGAVLHQLSCQANWEQVLVR